MADATVQCALCGEITSTSKKHVCPEQPGSAPHRERSTHKHHRHHKSSTSADSDKDDKPQLKEEKPSSPETTPTVPSEKHETSAPETPAESPPAKEERVPVPCSSVPIRDSASTVSAADVVPDFDWETLHEEMLKNLGEPDKAISVLYEFPKDIEVVQVEKPRTTVKSSVPV